MNRVLILALALASGGCSFKLVRPAPPRADWPTGQDDRTSQLKCTRSVAPPLIDTTLFVVPGTLAFIERNSGSPAFTLGLAVVSIPFLISAVYGAVNVSGCRSYQARFADAP